MQKRTFKYIYVFFDNEYSGWLRWNLYKPYKENRDKNYQFYGQSDYAKAYNEHLKKMQNYIYIIANSWYTNMDNAYVIILFYFER